MGCLNFNVMSLIQFKLGRASTSMYSLTFRVRVMLP